MEVRADHQLPGDHVLRVQGEHVCKNTPAQDALFSYQELSSATLKTGELQENVHDVSYNDNRGARRFNARKLK